MAVLKTGAAYVPVDRDHSRAVQLRRQPLPILVTQDALLSEISAAAARFVCIDDQDSGVGEGDIPTVIDSDNLAYVIHTSGSTGEPKRVMVPHGALASAWRCWEQDYALSRHADRCLQMASFGFDVFTADLVRSLCSGGTLVLCPRETLREPDELYALLRTSKSASPTSCLPCFTSWSRSASLWTSCACSSPDPALSIPPTTNTCFAPPASEHSSSMPMA